MASARAMGGSDSGPPSCLYHVGTVPEKSRTAKAEPDAPGHTRLTTTGLRPVAWPADLRPLRLAHARALPHQEPALLSLHAPSCDCDRQNLLRHHRQCCG